MPAVETIKLRGGTAAQWAAVNPVLASREAGVETDTRRMKVGDGVTAWTSLSYTVSIGNALAPGITILGDSIANNGGSFDSTMPNNQLLTVKGWASVANGLMGSRFEWVRPSVGQPGYFGTTVTGASGNASGVGFCIGGATTAMLNTYGFVTAAAASAASVVVVHIGTNDINAGMDGPTLAATLLAMWRALTAAGKTVVATTIMPRDSTVITGTKLTALNTANKLIRAYAAAEPRVRLCDWHASMLDATGAAPSGGGASAWTYDGLHPNPAGAWRMGSALALVLNALVPTGVSRDHLPLDPADTLTPNPFGFGNVSGVPTSWTVTTVGAPSSLVKSIVARTDLVSGQWEQIACTAATINTDGWSITVTDSTSADWASGPTVFATAEIQADAAGWDCRGFQLDVVLSGIATIASVGNIASSERTALTVGLQPSPTGGMTLVTPRIVVPTAGITAVRAVLRFFGSGTVRVSRLGVQVAS